jgi:hypothetical protein
MITPSFGLTATERVLPRLALDFTTATLDPRVTLTRALNTATRINSSGLIEIVNANLPRFDFTLNTGGSCKGLLIEESRVNLFQYTQDFNNAYWLKTGIASVNPVADVAPDGTTTANLVVLTGAAGGNQQIFRNETRTGTFTPSYYFKAAEAADIGKTLRIDTTGGGANATNFVLSDSWQRFSFTHSPTGFFQVRIISSPGLTADKFLVWGAQYEAGAFQTSYIPNLSTGTTTRNADVATMTGTNFSDWWQATTGALAVSAIPISISGITPLFQMDDNTADNIINLRGNAANPELYIKATTDQAQIDAGTIVANTAYKLSGAWNTDSCAVSQNGAAVVTDNTATIPTVTQARVGSDGTSYANAQIQKILYWPQRLINAEVQAFSK